MSDATRELPMPNVSKLCSLDQAQATLMHCLTKLSRQMQDLPSTPSGSVSQPRRPILEDDRQHYQRWLEQWELAFTTFLTHAMAAMSDEEVTQSRVLKANHLACTILAAGNTPAHALEAEFCAITELAGAVSRLRYFAGSPQNPGSNEPTTTLAMLDIADPLHVVLARCNQEATRQRAIKLLSQHYSEGRI